MLLSIIKDDQGGIVASTESNINISKMGETEVTDEINLEKPLLWSLESPHLYTLLQDLKVAEKIVDHRETTFGIRTLTYNATEGFLLNGKACFIERIMYAS